MTDWLSCACCATLYEYDCEQEVSDCPYCAALEEEIADATVAANLEPTRC
jgi:hypothetical protein